MAVSVLPNLRLQLEALYTAKGDEEKIQWTDISGQRRGEGTAFFRLQYVEFPVLVRVEARIGGSSHPALLVGPSIGLRSGATVGTEGCGDLDDESDVKELTSSTEFALVFGVGLDLPLASSCRSLGFDVRYSLGLTDVWDSQGSQPAKTRTLSVLVSSGLM